MSVIKEREYDPVWGITRDFKYNPDGKVEVYQSADVEPVKRRMQESRKTETYTNTGSKDLDHMNLYAELDYIHLHEALKDNVDINDGTAMIKWVNKKHPELKASTKWHADRRASKGKSGIIVRAKNFASALFNG